MFNRVKYATIISGGSGSLDSNIQGRNEADELYHSNYCNNKLFD